MSCFLGTLSLQFNCENFLPLKRLGDQNSEFPTANFFPLIQYTQPGIVKLILYIQNSAHSPVKIANEFRGTKINIKKM